jgi:VWFA-related protein
MFRTICVLATVLLTDFLIGTTIISAQTPTAAQSDDSVVFRSDVSLVRVDVQVMDGSRAVTGLTVEDFVLREGGKERVIRNFASEKMPIDVLFLFDVSASMRPHIQRVVNAAKQALNVLAEKDRVGIMVFDRSSRIRMSFRDSRDNVDREFQNVLRSEGFRGGTDITRGMLDAADYVEQNARRDARRAIVIVTDDETEMQRDDERVLSALDRAHAIMSALIAPDASMSNMGGGYPPYGMGRRRGGIGMGGMGVPIGGYPNNYPTNGGGSRTHSAGTSEIARDSGGESLPVDDASALETTLSRLRQRYSLYFQLPPGARRGQEREVEISLADDAMRRYSNADLRYRHTYIAPSDGPPAAPGEQKEPGSISRAPRPTILDNGDDPDSTTPKRRPAVSGPGGSNGGPIIVHNPGN